MLASNNITICFLEQKAEQDIGCQEWICGSAWHYQFAADISAEESSHLSVTHNTYTHASQSVTVFDTCDRDVKVEPDDDRFYPTDVVISIQLIESPHSLINARPEVTATKGHVTPTVGTANNLIPQEPESVTNSISHTMVDTLSQSITVTQEYLTEENKPRTSYAGIDNQAIHFKSDADCSDKSVFREGSYDDKRNTFEICEVESSSNRDVQLRRGTKKKT